MFYLPNCQIKSNSKICRILICSALILCPASCRPLYRLSCRPFAPIKIIPSAILKEVVHVEKVKKVHINIDYMKIDLGLSRILLDHKMTRKMFEKKSLNDGSIMSEAVSAYALHNIFRLKGLDMSLSKTEKEITYEVRNTKKTDYVTHVINQYHEKISVAVEVKRIISRRGSAFCVNKILDNANQKVYESGMNVSDDDLWDTQILHIITNVGDIADQINKWTDKTKIVWFSLIVITFVDGELEIII